MNSGRKYVLTGFCRCRRQESEASYCRLMMGSTSHSAINHFWTPNGNRGGERRLAVLTIADVESRLKTPGFN
jgi:hypothetical protein